MFGKCSWDAGVYLASGFLWVGCSFVGFGSGVGRFGILVADS